LDSISDFDAERVFMERQLITDPTLDWGKLVDHVYRDRVTVELERDKQVVATLAPVVSAPSFSDLNAIFAGVPPLSDAECASFAKDLEEIGASMPPETDPWG
jgi:hypothetical protein